MTAHEFFHVVQFGYCFARDSSGQESCPEWKQNWLFEGTARWIEDKIVPYKKDWYAYGYGSETFGWEDSGGKQSIFSAPNAYAASYFFQYLSERAPEGINIIRKIWALVKSDPRENAYEAVVQAVGGKQK